MKLLAKYLLIFLLLFSYLVIPVQNVEAADDCSTVGVTTDDLGGSYESGEIDSLNITFTTQNLNPNKTYRLKTFDRTFTTGGNAIAHSNGFTVTAGQDSVTANIADSILVPGRLFDYSGIANQTDDKHVYLYEGPAVLGSPVCYLGSFEITKSDSRVISCPNALTIVQTRDVNGTDQACYYNNGSGCIDVSKPITLRTEGIINKDDGTPYSGDLNFSDRYPARTGKTTVQNGVLEFQYNPSSDGDATLRFSPSNMLYTLEGPCQETSITVQGNCLANQCETTDTTPDTDTPGFDVADYDLCLQISNQTLQQECIDCAGTDGGQDGIWTAIGCIKRDPVSIAQRFIQVGLGIGGGFALLTILAAGFILSTSQGDPQKASQAKEMITNAIIGLLFIIFSVVILQFIGVTILNIPGFGTGTTQ